MRRVVMIATAVHGLELVLLLVAFAVIACVTAVFAVLYVLEASKPHPPAAR
jgi:hypothetical protein